MRTVLCRKQPPVGAPVQAVECEDPMCGCHAGWRPLGMRGTVTESVFGYSVRVQLEDGTRSYFPPSHVAWIREVADGDG